MDKDNNVNNVNNVRNMTKAERKREITNAVIRFKGEMTSAGDSLTRAAKIYADTIVKFGDYAGEAFRKEYPWVTTVTWTKLLRLAAGQIIPEMDEDDVARVLSKVHDYLGELVRDGLVGDTVKASELADEVWDAMHYRKEDTDKHEEDC